MLRHAPVTLWNSGGVAGCRANTHSGDALGSLQRADRHVAGVRQAAAASGGPPTTHSTRPMCPTSDPLAPFRGSPATNQREDCVAFRPPFARCFNTQHLEEKQFSRSCDLQISRSQISRVVWHHNEHNKHQREKGRCVAASCISASLHLSNPPRGATLAPWASLPTLTRAGHNLLCSWVIGRLTAPTGSGTMQLSGFLAAWTPMKRGASVGNGLECAIKRRRP